MANGFETLVTDQNKKDYVARICEMKMKNEIQQELVAFLEGFFTIIPHENLGLFSVSELQQLIAGTVTIDLQDMQNNAIYVDYDSDDSVIEWFWEILEEFTQEQLATFLFFVSGSYLASEYSQLSLGSLKPPYGGFKQGPLKIIKLSSELEKLPVSHTW